MNTWSTCSLAVLKPQEKQHTGWNHTLSTCWEPCWEPVFRKGTSKWFVHIVQVLAYFRLALHLVGVIIPSLQWIAARFFFVLVITIRAASQSRKVCQPISSTKSPHRKRSTSAPSLHPHPRQGDLWSSSLSPLSSLTDLRAAAGAWNSPIRSKKSPLIVSTQVIYWGGRLLKTKCHYSERSPCKKTMCEIPQCGGLSHQEIQGWGEILGSLWIWAYLVNKYPGLQCLPLGPPKMWRHYRRWTSRERGRADNLALVDQQEKGGESECGKAEGRDEGRGGLGRAKEGRLCFGREWGCQQWCGQSC